MDISRVKDSIGQTAGYREQDSQATVMTMWNTDPQKDWLQKGQDIKDLRCIQNGFSQIFPSKLLTRAKFLSEFIQKV